MHITSGRLAVLGLIGCLALGPIGCKKKSEKGSDKDDMAAMDAMEAMDDMATMEAMDDMGPMATMEAMGPMAVKEKPKPKPLSFQEKLALSIPLTPKPAEQKAGKLTIKAELCAVEGIKLLSENNMRVLQSVAVHRRQMYVVNEKNEVLRFLVAPGKACKLTLDKKWGKDGVLKAPSRADKVAVDRTGTLVVSSFMGIHVIRKDKVAYDCGESGARGSVALHPSGRWGLSYFVGSTVQKYSFAAKACKAEPWALQNLSSSTKRKGPLSSVNTIGFYRNLVLVGGILAKKIKGFPPRVVVAFDGRGKQKFQFGALEGHGDDRFGWIHAIAQGKKAQICVLDANYRRLSLWDARGKFIGAVKLGSLFDLRYPWIADFTVGADGKAWFVAGQDRELKKKIKDQRISVAEGLIYRVTGL